MKVLFLNPPFFHRYSREQRSPAVTKSGTLYYPMWLAYAAGSVQKAGFEILLLDPPAKGVSLEDTLNRSEEFGPDLLIMVTSTPSIKNDMKVAEAYRERFPNITIGFVGTHVSALPTQTLEECPAATFIARHEYDNTCVDVAQRLAGGQSLEGCLGITLRQGDDIIEYADRPYLTREELDAQPFVSSIYHQFLDVEDYFYSITRYPMLTIITGRGCPYKCNYCVYPQTMHGNGYRFRSPENVAEEIAYCRTTFPDLQEVFIEDDTLTVNKARCRKLASALIEQKNTLSITANSRADVDYETMSMMKQGGFRLFCVGVESGTQNILDNVEKGIQLNTIRQFVKDAKKANIMVHGCFMVGNKGETRETMEETLKFAQELNPDTAQFFPLMVYPGTKAYDWASSNKYLESEDFSRWVTDEGLHNSMVSTEHLSHQDLVDFCQDARLRFYLRPAYVWQKTKQSVTSYQEFKRNLMSAKTLSQHLFKKIAS